MLQNHRFVCLRALREEDAPLMLEWMHDKNITEHLRADFENKTADDCLRFIRDSAKEKRHLHLAVTNEDGIYMGTVSLKNISPENHTAEFGICMRRSAMGTGLAGAAMKEILSFGYEELGLRAVFWCVSIHNERANRFYRKNGYITVSQAPDQITQNYAQYLQDELIWYCAEKPAGR